MLARPRIASRNADLELVEFPVSLLLIGLVVWKVVKPTPTEPSATTPPWRRHEQVVRALPDPESLRLRSTLATWVLHGSQRAEASDILANAATLDEAARARLQARHADAMAAATTAKRRAEYLREHERTSLHDHHRGA
jgi:hypothetical protein